MVFVTKFILLVALHIVGASSQTSEAESACKPQPTVQCNYGLYDAPPVVIGSKGPPNIAQGKPGRIGPPGPKGLKGEPGQTDETRSELRSIQQQIRELKRVNDEQQNSIENLRNILSSAPATCAHISSRENLSGTFLIFPEQNNFPLRVFCNFSRNQADTVIYHNFPDEENAGNCDERRCDRHKVTYDATMPQIKALIDQSTQCRQFIKYRCQGSVLFFNSTPTFAAWLSRDGTPQIYWGGATSRRNQYCACGETRSCVNNRYKCNCDRNTAAETSDEGFLTDKNTLPVTELQFVDLGDSGEDGWFTLGPLICSGRAN